ncbi:MAG: leucine-rich repeat protein [Candidatus Methanoplasma sp.]|jgi:uncharacterized repeat protein (TIGR02543 family)|nr:leucine-rich repeat protein [Candidatus Methanoplasma sp.]
MRGEKGGNKRLIAALSLLLVAAVACGAWIALSGGSGGEDGPIGGGDGGGGSGERYTVRFDSQGGTAVGSETAGYNEKIHAPRPPEKDGYAFDEWHREPECVNEWDFATDAVVGDMTLYAKWCIIDSGGNVEGGDPYETYEVAFDSMGGSPVPSVAATEGSAISEPAQPTRTGYDFKGWYKERGCRNPWSFQLDLVYSNTTLYAGWDQRVTVAYDYQWADGGDSRATDGFEQGDPFSLPAPTRSGYSFGGWFLMPGGVNSAAGSAAADNVTPIPQSGQSWPHSGRVSLYALWLGTAGLAYAETSPGKLEVSVGSASGEPSISIPEYRLGMEVESIAYRAFYDEDTLKEIRLPRTLRIIGEDAFYACEIQAVSVPDGVTHIGDSAFWACLEMVSVDLPDSLVSIGEYAFSMCEELTGVSIPDGVTEIPEGAFKDCNELKSAGLGAGITKIGDLAFSNCWALASIDIPDGVTEIGQEAFNRCEELVSAKIPDTVTVIGNSAFYECHSLSNLTLGRGLEEIGENAFDNCWALDGVTLPGSLKRIGDAAFVMCTSLTSIDIPVGVEEMGTNVFYCCQELVSATIPYTLKRIGDWAFEECNKLATVTIADGVEEIGMMAFRNCWVLDGVSIPDTVRSIEYQAFEGCSALTDIYIPAGVTVMGRNAFQFCPSLSIRAGASGPAPGWDPGWNPDPCPVSWDEPR